MKISLKSQKRLMETDLTGVYRNFVIRWCLVVRIPVMDKLRIFDLPVPQIAARSVAITIEQLTSPIPHGQGNEGDLYFSYH